MIEELTVKHRRFENEMRVKLDSLTQDNTAKDRVIAEKSKKMDELHEKLLKKAANPPTPADIAKDILAELSKTEISARSEISKLTDIFDGLIAHTETHGIDHSAKMVGAINQLILDCEILRGQYLLPTDAPTDDVPVWLNDEGDDDNGKDNDNSYDDRNVPLPFDDEEA